MVTVSRRGLLPLLAPILGPTVFSMLAPNPIQASETQSFLLAIAPVKHHSPWATWQGGLDHSLTTTSRGNDVGRPLTTNHVERGVQYCLSQIGDYAANRRRPNLTLQ
jgi:hypothetical protein